MPPRKFICLLDPFVTPQQEEIHAFEDIVPNVFPHVVDSVSHVDNRIRGGLLELLDASLVVDPGPVKRILGGDGDKLPNNQFQRDFANI